jgi:hypothetical protein
MLAVDTNSQTDSGKLNWIPNSMVVIIKTIQIWILVQILDQHISECIKAIKKAYDPDNVFKNEQSIPVA